MHGHNRTPFIGYHRVYVCQGPALRLRDRSDRVVRLTDIGAVSVVLTSWLYLSSALRKLIEVLIGIEDSLGLIYTCTAWHVILLNVSLAYIRQSDVRAAVVYQYRSVAGDHIVRVASLRWAGWAHSADHAIEVQCWRDGLAERIDGWR